MVLELVKLSSELFSALDQCMEVMVPLLQRASSLMTEEEDKDVVDVVVGLGKCVSAKS